MSLGDEWSDVDAYGDDPSRESEHWYTELIDEYQRVGNDIQDDS